MTKLQELCEQSSKIIKKQNELLELIINNSLNPDNQHLLIEELKELIEQESKIIEELSIDETDQYLANFFQIFPPEEEMSIDEKTIQTRMSKRLKNKVKITSGKKQKVTLKNKNRIFTSYITSVIDMILSSIYIQVIKKMKEKIFTATAFGNQDISFINELKQRYRLFSVVTLFDNFDSEMRGLYANLDIDNIIIPDIEKIRNLNLIPEEEFKKLLITEIKDKINQLANIQILSNNPDDVFKLLRLVTIFEVIISYMDKESLGMINEYCQSLTTDKNKPCMSGINTIIARKLK